MSAVLTAYARALLPGAGFLRQLSIIEADRDECTIPNVGTADGPAHMVFYTHFPVFALSLTRLDLHYKGASKCSRGVVGKE